MQVVQYTLIRSRRRHRSAALQVKSSGEVVVQAPWYMPKFMIDQFVKEHEHWIGRRVAELARPSSPRTQYFATEQALKDFISQRLSHFEKEISLYSKSIGYKTVHSYWGNCAITGKIIFNLELMYAPPEAVEYVVVHELAHLRYRGHGVRFWQLVNEHYPRANEMRRLLRQIGHQSRLTSPEE